jgi:hypothetical protein
MLLIAAKRSNVKWAIGSGLLLGAACWMRVNPLLLSVTWALALLLLLRAPWRQRLRMGAAVAFSALILVAPITIRNALVFHEFLPNGLNVGSILWEGLGETDRGVQAGMAYGDQPMLEIERKKLNLQGDPSVDLAYPDGIRRDRQRVKESLEVIAANPLWYVGVMTRRALGLLKLAGDPAPFQASPGINVTSKKCLPPAWQGGVIAVVVDGLGMMQSVLRYLSLPLMVLGIWFGFRANRLASGLLLIGILYYLLTNSVGHTEMRYALPMYALLFVFAGLAISKSIEVLAGSKEPS